MGPTSVKPDQSSADIEGDEELKTRQGRSRAAQSVGDTSSGSTAAPSPLIESEQEGAALPQYRTLVGQTTPFALNSAILSLE